MTKSEFITLAASLGYCTKAEAGAYAGQRDEFTEADFEEVFRYAEPAVGSPARAIPARRASSSGRRTDDEEIHRL